MHIDGNHFSEETHPTANFIKNKILIDHMKLSYTAGFILVLLVGVFIAGCSTKYVCYDNTTQKNQELCPTYPRVQVTAYDAGRAADNFGNAVAIAKTDQYTRVNVYLENGTWYSTVLFTNRETQAIHRILLKIDGQTSDVTCVTNCDYLGFE